MNFIQFLQDKSPETYLDEKLKICKEIDVLPRELTDCVCCERHKINFPSIGNPVKYNLFKNNTPNACECPCRHISRMICREWELVNEIEDLDSEDISEESDVGSLEDFIVPDEGFTKKERKKLDRALNHFRSHPLPPHRHPRPY
jgi:hypothetical protein